MSKVKLGLTKNSSNDDHTNLVWPQTSQKRVRLPYKFVGFKKKSVVFTFPHMKYVDIALESIALA
jgi:hypothetical protein